MKVLLCTNQYTKIANGPVLFAHYLAQMPDWEVRILTEDIDQPDEQHYRLEIAPWQQKSIFSQFFRMWLYHRQAMRIRKTFRFDVLLYNHALTGAWSALWFKQTVGCINDEQYASSVTLKGIRSALRYWLFRSFEYLSYRHCAKIIVNSHYLHQVIMQAYGQREAVHVLYKSTRVEESVIANDFSKRPIKLLFIKSDFRTGGLSILLEALTHLAFEYELHIVGDAPRLEEFINSFALPSSVQERIVLHHYLPPVKVKKLLRSCHIVCIPSLREALGLANIEALANGISVISTQVGGIPEVLNWGANGWLVPPGQSHQLSQALHECIHNQELREQRRKNGLEFVKRFSVENMYAQLRNIFNNSIHE